MRKRSTPKYKFVDHLTTTYEAHVSFHDADPLGIVWHGNYVKFFEKGREAFGRKHGLDYGDIYNNGYSTPVVHLECDYKVSLRYGDVYRVVTSMALVAGAKIILVYQIFNESDILVCEGTTTQVFVNLDGELALYSPDFYEIWKKKVNFN